MKKTLAILFTFFLLISCSNDDENIFKTKKVVFKEKKEQLLYFKDQMKVELSEDAKTLYYTETEKNNGDNEYENTYFIFESETKFKLIGFFDKKEDEEKSWNYKFENGLLKIEYKGKYFPVCVGNSPNKLTIIIDSYLYHKETIDGSSISTISGTLGSGDVVPTRTPLSFELAIKFLDFEKIEDIDGNDYLYLQREEITFE